MFVLAKFIRQLVTWVLPLYCVPFNVVLSGERFRRFPPSAIPLIVEFESFVLAILPANIVLVTVPVSVV